MNKHTVKLRCSQSTFNKSKKSSGFLPRIKPKEKNVQQHLFGNPISLLPGIFVPLYILSGGLLVSAFKFPDIQKQGGGHPEVQPGPWLQGTGGCSQIPFMISSPTHFRKSSSVSLPTSFLLPCMSLNGTSIWNNEVGTFLTRFQADG